MKLKFVLITLFICAIGFAQNKGTVSGTLLDKESNNQPLPFANVLIKGTTIGVNTDIDGKYSITLAAGNYTIQFSFVGYENIEMPITVKANETLVINKTLGSGNYTLKDVVVKAKASREKETAILLDQKNAVQIKQAIGAEELSRKGISDVAAAVTKISGISKQESSGSVFVRGLGDRYNITTLNGLPLPSNNPSNKNIMLDIFSTDIVESIGISKTFESQNYADFGGAKIDIVSKKMNGKSFVQVGTSIGANTNVLNVDDFYLQDGPSYSGFKTVTAPSDTSLPSNFSTSWDRKKSDRTLNNNFGISGGKKFSFGKESSIGTFITASFDTDSKYIEGYDRGSVNAQGDIYVDYYKKSNKYNTNSTVMGTADYKINSKNSILFTSLFLNSTSQDYSEYKGTNVDFPGSVDVIGYVKRGTFDKTQLIVNQLLGKHKFNDRLTTDWAVGYSILENTIPDRMQNTFAPAANGSGDYTFVTTSSINNHRYFQTLDEKELSANISATYNFNKKEDEFKGKLTVGYSGRMKNVDFNSQQYSFFPQNNKTLFQLSGINNTDFYLGNTNFNLASGDYSSKLLQLYNGHLNTQSAYGNLLYNFNDKLSVIIGGRFEQIDQYVYFKSQIKPNGDKSYFSPIKVLPSLIAKYKLNDKQNMKFALSNTYTLPQFKEKVRILFEDVQQTYEGNSKLYASTNYNADLSWELYPSKEEILTVTAFGKLIQNPINEMFTNSSSGNITYANTGKQAVVAGIELEVRKNLIVSSDEDSLKQKLSAGFNGSYMYQDQDLSNTKVLVENGFGANFTFTNSKLSGASDFLANADITFLKEFKNDKDITATLTYAYVSDKLAVLGTSARANLIDKAIDRLDFILKSSLTKNLKIGFSYKNILNAKYERISQLSKAPIKSNDVLVSSYKLGSNLSFSVSYKF